MRGFRPCLAAILPLLLVAAAAAHVPTGEPGFDVVGRWAPGAPAALVLDGRLAYLGHGARLEAVYLGTPETPKRLGYVDFPSAVTDLAARDSYLYVTTSDGAFSVVDARRPRQLRVVARLDPTEDARYGRVELTGGVAYCVGGSLSVIDLGVPTAPRVVRTMPMPLCSDVAVEGSRLYVAAADGLHVLDIADPQTPIPLEIVGYGNLEQPWWLQAHEGKVYAGNSNGVFVYCLADAACLGGYLLPDTAGYVSAVAFDGAEVYVASGQVTKYNGPAIVPDWMLWGLGETTAIAIDGDLLVVAYRYSGFVTYAIGGTGEPRQLAAIETGTPIENATSDGTRLWLACRRGVRLLDLSDPANPRQAGSLATRPDPHVAGMDPLSVCPRGDMAVVLGVGEVNLLVVEATPHGTLREIFRAPPAADGSASPFHAAVATSDGWIVWSEEGVFGLRLGRGGRVDMVPITWPAGLGPAAKADGEVLYARDNQNYLNLLTATAAGVVQRLGSVSLDGTPAQYFSARDGLIWMAEWRGVQVVEIRDPAHPRLGGSVYMHDWRLDLIDGIAAAGPVAFALSRGHGMMLAEAADPYALTLDRVWLDNSHPYAIAAVGDMACLFDWAGIMTIVRPQPLTVAAAPLAPAQTARLAVAPNPCNPRATITFTMANAGPATVRVFDARGRLVRQLHDGWLDSGAHGLSWSGDDDNGRPVATGVYLVRAESGGDAETARVTVVK
jgi:hypothetical protein